jgi:uncharacterized protein
MIIGREKEIEKLEESLKSKESELIAVYGRRRIGKTFLVREVYKKQIVFELVGLFRGTMGDQLRNFHDQLKDSSIKFKDSPIPKDWAEAFGLLKKYINGLKAGKKKVIFIDEFPWIATARSKFLMIFENFWNAFCTTKKDLVVIVCGSAAAYMVKNIINNRGGLHNRLSQKIQLEAFNLYETKLLLNSRNIRLNDYSIIQLYMVIGGIPHYLKMLRKGESTVQAVDRLCFEKGGDLTNEFNEVFKSLFGKSILHETIVKGLATSQNGILREELLKVTKLPSNGDFSKALNELIDSGFAQKYAPYGKVQRKSLYRLTDELSLFHIKFIEPYKDQGAGTWSKLFSKPTNVIWSGFVFESICIKHVAQIKKALKIAGIRSINSSWTNGKAQVDLVIARDDSRVNLCEMKFYNKEFTIDKKGLINLKNKVEEFTKDTKFKGQVVITMITTYGVEENGNYHEVVENSFKMDCLFEKVS